MHYLVQAAYDALITRYTGEVNAWNQERQGDYYRRTYNQKAFNALTSGIFNAGSYAMKAFEQYKLDKQPPGSSYDPSGLEVPDINSGDFQWNPGGWNDYPDPTSLLR